MKKTCKTILSTLFLFISVQLFAQKEVKPGKEKKRYENFKERNISKTYAATGNSLNIENQFGNVKISTWDKNEIKVDIHIEASSTDKALADKTFERLDVKDSQAGKEINFKTLIGNGDMNECKNCNSTMSVDYDIHMPADNKLIIENTFGSIELPDYKGAVSLTCKYGSLTAGNLSNAEKLWVEFGSTDLKSLSNIDLTFKYTSITIGSLSGKSKISMEFCPYSKITLDNSLQSLTLDDSYSVVHLQPAANLGASYDISTSYGSLIDKTNSIKRTDSPERFGPDLDKHYEGKSGSGATKIEIKSNFGTIMIGEGTELDMKEKKKVRS